MADDEKHFTLDRASGTFVPRRLWTVGPDTSLVFDIPLEMAWFSPLQLHQACEAAEKELGKIVSIIPGERIEIVGEQENVQVDLDRVKLLVVKALGVNAAIRRVTRGYHACESCLDRKGSRLYVIDFHGRFAFCPKCATRYMTTHALRPPSIVEILEVA